MLGRAPVPPRVCTVDSLRVAVLAALNLADELSQTQRAAAPLRRVGHARAGLRVPSTKC
jgi:cell division protein ZapA (FtsZ GTPase activity inhibitor)